MFRHTGRPTDEQDSTGPASFEQLEQTNSYDSLNMLNVRTDRLDG